MGDFQLLDRRVVDAMRRVRDGYPFMRMMTFECGGRSVGVSYRWRARKKGLLGLIGEYVLAIYGQVRAKPVVFERERINFAHDASDAGAKKADPKGGGPS